MTPAPVGSLNPVPVPVGAGRAVPVKVGCVRPAVGRAAGSRPSPVRAGCWEPVPYPLGVPIVRGPRGPAGDGKNPSISIPFQWNNVHTQPVGTVPAGRLVTRVTVFFLVPFPAGGAVSVGDAVDPDRLMGPGENDPRRAGAYAVSPGVVYGADTVVVLSVYPGAGNTAGSGIVVVEHQA